MDHKVHFTKLRHLRNTSYFLIVMSVNCGKSVRNLVNHKYNFSKILEKVSQVIWKHFIFGLFMKVISALGIVSSFQTFFSLHKSYFRQTGRPLPNKCHSFLIHRNCIILFCKEEISFNSAVNTRPHAIQ